MSVSRPWPTGAPASIPWGAVWLVCAAYLVLALTFATEKLDGDEFHVVKEPYEMLGGDYTVGYLKEGAYGQALATAWKSYVFYWRYRPMFAPIIAEEHQDWFRAEERKFGYEKPESVPRGDPNALERYQQRLIVPEPDRFYQHGAGKPLLPGLLSIPQLALIELVSSGEALLRIQYRFEHHPLFIATRLVQMVAGLATILLVACIVGRELAPHLAPLGAALTAFVPLTPMYFPDLHSDSVLTPFVILAAYMLFRGWLVLGGIAFGLALASKNTAVFLPAAFALFYLLEGLRAHGMTMPAAGILWQRARALTVFVLTGLVVMIPFSHPGSFLIEVLTPVIDRPFDPRGEDVSRWIIGSGSTGEAVSADDRLTGAVSLESIHQLFVLIGGFLAFQLKLHPLARLSLVMLVLAIPYGVIFSYSFNWRYLMFVPFLAVFCVDALRRPFAWGLAGVLAVFTLAAILDLMPT